MHPKLTEREVREIRALHRRTSMSINEIARVYHVTKGNVSHIIHRRTWKHVT